VEQPPGEDPWRVVEQEVARDEEQRARDGDRV
jgi:hypothetical protein